MGMILLGRGRRVGRVVAAILPSVMVTGVARLRGKGWTIGVGFYASLDIIASPNETHRRPAESFAAVPAGR